MKVLQICSQPPYPDNNGASKAFLSIAQGLLQIGIDLNILSFATPASQPVFNEGSKLFYKKTNYSFVDIDNSIKPFDALINLFKKESYNISRFVTNEFEAELEKILKENSFDVIQFETLFTTPYLATAKKLSNAKMVYRSHNIEHLIWERRAEITKNPLKKWYLNHLAKKLKDFETEIVNNFDGIVSISEIDEETQKNYLNPKVKTTSIPIGFDIAESNPVQPEEISFFFIGALDWAPNEQGLRWFLENVWEAVYKQFPDYKFYVAGRNIPSELYKWGRKNVEICGEVPSSMEFIENHSIMIVPLFFGSGIRVKIAEAMSLGKTIISTNIGAEGILCKNFKEILFANTKEEFIQMITHCIENPSLVQSISEYAFQFAKGNFDCDSLAKRLVNFYENL